VLRRALADCTAWTAAGHDWAVAVNLSHRNLASLEFADTVSQILQEAGVRPDLLHLEVTETALAFNIDVAERAVRALAAQGISIAIADFGTGFTGLSQLRTVQVSEVKIDPTFLTDLPGNQKARAIVRSVIDLGHSLGCVVTAEGVESQDVADALADAGCDQAQGYLWRRPCPWTEVAHAFGVTPAHAASTATTTTAGSGSDATGSAPTLARRGS